MHYYSSSRSSCSRIKVQSHFSWSLTREGSVSVLNVILWKSSKMSMWSFRHNVSAMCICYEIQKLRLMDCSYLRLRKRQLWNNQRLRWFVQLYLKKRLGLGTQQESPDRYSYGRANSHKSCMDQEDRWVIKFRWGLNLFDLIKLWTP